MEVSNEIKEDIRKTQTDLKNAIRIHQVWISRLQDDKNNKLIRIKIKEAEKNIVAIGHSQKRVVDRLRKELELYQQRLKARNRQINIDNDNEYIAQQLRDHQLQYRKRYKPLSLLKPVLNNIHSVIQNNDDTKLSSSEASDEECDIKANDKELSNSSDGENKDSQQHFVTATQQCRSNVAGTLLKVRENLEDAKSPPESDWIDRRESDEESCTSGEISPSPPPPELPPEGESVDQELFLGLLGLLTLSQKENLDKKRSDRRKRSNKGELEDENVELKRKKLNFSYLQTPTAPPETRSAKQKKEQKISDKENSNSREPSPSPSPSDKSECANKPEWQISLPEGLSVVPVYPDDKKACNSCGGKDVPSLLVQCTACGDWQHTGCGSRGRCARCLLPLPDPAPAPAVPLNSDHMQAEKLKQRQELQEKNVRLCMELQKLLARADVLKENLDDRHEEKRKLLTEQIKTQQDLQKLLDFVNQFRETSLSIHSTSVSDSGSEKSRSNEE